MGLTLCFLILASILYLFYVRGVKFSERKSKEIEFQQFLFSLNDKNFFCYNNKKEVEAAIETLLVPKLSDEIEIIYLNGRNPESAYDKLFVGLMLLKLKDYSKFPHLIKIRNGKVLDLSINNDFYNMIGQKKPLDSLVEKIYEFFELDNRNV